MEGASGGGGKTPPKMINVLTGACADAWEPAGKVRCESGPGELSYAEFFGEQIGSQRLIPPHKSLVPQANYCVAGSPDDGSCITSLARIQRAQCPGSTS